MLAPVGEATWGEEALLDARPGVACACGRISPPSSRTRAGRDVGYLRCGALHVALDADEAAELARRYDLMRSLGLEAEWLRRRACRELEPGLGPSAFAGVHAPHEAGVDPVALSRRSARAARARASRSSPAPRSPSAIATATRSAGVATADGAEHRADATVLAAGAWSGSPEWLPEEAPRRCAR